MTITPSVWHIFQMSTLMKNPRNHQKSSEIIRNHRTQISTNLHLSPTRLPPAMACGVPGTSWSHGDAVGIFDQRHILDTPNKLGGWLLEQHYLRWFYMGIVFCQKKLTPWPLVHWAEAWKCCKTGAIPVSHLHARAEQWRFAVFSLSLL